jgi:hypothetical protein
MSAAAAATSAAALAFALAAPALAAPASAAPPSAAPPSAAEADGRTDDTPNGVALLAFLSMKASVSSLTSDFNDRDDALGLGLEARYTYRAARLLHVACGASYDHLFEGAIDSPIAHQIRLPVVIALVAPITGGVELTVGGEIGPTFLFLPKQPIRPEAGTMHAFGASTGPVLGLRFGLAGGVDVLAEGRLLITYSSPLNGGGRLGAVPVFVTAPAVGIGAQHRF